MQSKLKQYNLRIDDELLEKLSNTAGENVSEFIRQSIVEKLNRKKISTDETYHLLKKIDKLDTDSVYQIVHNIQLTVEVIYEEMNKQNEILKLILRRSTFASGFSSRIFAKGINSGTNLEEIKNQLAKAVDEDIKHINI